MKEKLKEKIKLGNKKIIEKGNLDFIPELFAVNYIVHSGEKNDKGHKFIKRWVTELRSAINGIRITKIEFIIQTDDFIVWQRTLSGMHTGKM